MIELLLIAAVELLPLEEIYPPYLAAPKEPRISDIKLWDPDQGWLWDITLGGRAGLLRIEAAHAIVHINLEGAAFLRLDLDDDRDLISTEFKYGAHVFVSFGEVVLRLGYYHLSAHLGDETIRAHPQRRPNGYSRDTFVGGLSFQPPGGFRIYGQLGFAALVEGPAERWEIEVGAEWSWPSDDRIGRPFAAVHAHLRQENDFAGNFSAQAGWHWRVTSFGATFRLGLHYYRGPSTQYQFFELVEEQLGLGTWFDF